MFGEQCSEPALVPDIVCNSIARFAGHIARIQMYDPSRLTVATLHWRNGQWLNLVASNNNGNQLHCRKLKVWRWETNLIKMFGESWEQDAFNKDDWEIKAHEFARRFVLHT